MLRPADMARWTRDETRDYYLHLVMRGLPAPLCSVFGARLSGPLGRALYPEADARARRLMTAIRPDFAEPAAMEAALARLWSNIGRTFAEYAALARLSRPRYCRIDGAERLEAAYRAPRPVILCFIHTGNWEIVARQALTHPAAANRRAIAPFMPPDNRAHAAIAAARRADVPVDLLPMSPTLWRRVRNVLSRPDGVALIAGDEVVDGRVSGPRFGRRLQTTGNLGKIVRLAAATGAVVVPLYNERISRCRFVSYVHEPLEMPQGRLSEAEREAQVARLDAVLEALVRPLADQWYMAIEFSHDPADPVRRATANAGDAPLSWGVCGRRDHV